MSSSAKILITGSSGLLGSQLIYDCLKQGIRPICLVRNNSDCSYIDSHGLQKRYADLRNQDELTKAFEGIDSVIHTAAIVDFRGDKLTLFTGINSFGALFCYRAAISAGVRRFIQVSTIAAVGAVKYRKSSTDSYTNPQPLTENAEFNLTDLNIPYILSKYQAERLLFEARNNNSESSESNSHPELIIVNPSIIVAPSRHKADKSRIDKLMARPILPKSDIQFNIVDIRDVSRAIIIALEKGKDGERYLLTGENLTLTGGLNIFSSLTNRNPWQIPLSVPLLKAAVKLAYLLRRKGNKLRLYPDLIKMLDFHWIYDNSKARRELDFNPRAVRITLRDLYSGSFEGFYFQDHAK